MFPFVSLSAFFLPPHFSLSLYLSLSCSYLSSLLPVSRVTFWFLRFVIGLFAFCFKMFFCFCFLIVVSFLLVVLFVLNHNLIFVFALHLVFLLLLFFFYISYSLIFSYLSKNLSEKLEQQKWTMQKKKTDTLTRAVSTSVFTNSVFFFFLCSLNLHVCWKHCKYRGFSPPPPQKNKQKTNNFCMLKTGPSIS